MAGASFNKVILVGRLTRDPEIKYTPQGTQLAKFGLAVDNPRSKDKQADFFNITAWQKLAEICGQYLKKGKLVLIEGRLQSRSYETQDGQKKTSVDIVAETMQMLGGKSDGDSSYQGAPARSGGGAKKTGGRDMDDLNIDNIEVDEFDAEDMPF